jgi:DDE superfamily endonuclease
LPKKRSKKNPLSKEDKVRNQLISSSRVAVENIIREIKIFRIVAEKYRNRRKRFALRFNLISAIYNLAIL